MAPSCFFSFADFIKQRKIVESCQMVFLVFYKIYVTIKLINSIIQMAVPPAIPRHENIRKYLL